MKLPNKTFCILPWVSLEVGPVGTFRPCCLADHEVTDIDGNKLRVGQHSLHQVQTSESMNEMRRQFLNGERPETCRKCWNEEDAGRTSKRMHTITRLSKIIEDTVWTNDAKTLIFLDLKLGNICNLKCRICGSWSSSQFAAEEIQWTPSADRKQTFAYQMLKSGAWPRNNDSFWKQIDSIGDQLRYLEFTGGEPFMIREHFDMLRGLVEKGLSSQVEIHYNTNGTIYPEEAEELWREFKTVEIAFSIDDLGDRFEYQRSNAKWDEVCDNIERFKDLRKRLSNVRLQCCSTVNVFNIRYLDHLAKWISMQAFDFVYWNIMHDAWYFSVASLPENAKNDLVSYYKNVDIPEQYRGDFDGIMEFMRRGKSSDGHELRKQLSKLDQRRGENFAVISPEMAALIDYEKP